MARARRDSQTLDLLGWEPESVGADAPAFRGPAELVIPRLVSDALKVATDAGQDREAVAHALTLRLNRRVSKDTLDAWASPGRTSNRMPADAMLELMTVTGELDLLRMMARRLGYELVEAEHADVIRDVVLVKKIEERERKLAALKAEAQARLGGRS